MQDNRRPSRTALWLALGLGVGAVGLIAFGVRQAYSKKRTQDADNDALPQIAPEPGDILLFHHAKGVNKIITLVTGSPFYHSALYVSKDKAVEARLAGVLYRDMQRVESKYVVVPAPHGRGAEALAWAESQLGDAYDSLDLVVIVLDKLFRFVHFNYTPKDKFSCGEFVATAYDKAGIRLVPEKAINEIVPGDFATLLPDGKHVAVRIR